MNSLPVNSVWNYKLIKMTMLLFYISSIALFGITHCSGSVCSITDDGKTGIEIDLHGDIDWKCPTSKWTESNIIQKTARSQCSDDLSAYHVCMDQTIDDKYPDRIPNRGPHRKALPVYGEYKYLPPGRYVHSLEHGGVVFMYHPCAPVSMIDQLRRVAVSCLNRRVITAFRNLTMEYPIAVLTYGCVLEMTAVNPHDIKQWLREKFAQSPEANEYINGVYNHDLLLSAANVGVEDTVDKYCLDSDMDNVPLPLILPTSSPTTTTEKILSTPTLKLPTTSSTTTTATTSTSTSTTSTSTTSTMAKVATDRLSTNRKIRSTTRPHSTSNSTNDIGEVTPASKEEAKWAIGCVVFLLIVLFGAVWYSKMWRTNFSDHFDPNSDDKPDVYVNGTWKQTISIKSLGKKLFNKRPKKQNYKLVEDNADSEDEIY